jgi:hypothetical protein
MNIKEHIEAGHYKELGEHNAERVPTSDGRKATICDVRDDGLICGWLDGWKWACTWNADGNMLSNGLSPHSPMPHLLPPPPRKRTIKGTLRAANPRCLEDWIVMRLEGDYRDLPVGTHVTFTAEYEEPW